VILHLPLLSPFLPLCHLSVEVIKPIGEVRSSVSDQEYHSFGGFSKADVVDFAYYDEGDED